MMLNPDVNVVKLLKALDSSWRLQIVRLVINSSSPVSFSAIHEHLENQIGRKINRGAITYHLDLLVQCNVLDRELGRKPKERTYSSYNITDYAAEKLESLGLLAQVGAEVITDTDEERKQKMEDFKDRSEKKYEKIHHLMIRAEKVLKDVGTSEELTLEMEEFEEKIKDKMRRTLKKSPLHALF